MSRTRNQTDYPEEFGDSYPFIMPSDSRHTRLGLTEKRDSVFELALAEHRAKWAA